MSARFANFDARKLTEMVTRSQLPSPAERRAIRLKAAVTVRELAFFLGVSPMTLSRWELGQATPRREAADRYRQALNALRGVEES